jgi:hypothetical protein
MTVSTPHRLTLTALVTSAVLGASLVVPPAQAAAGWEDFGPPDPAGVACADFPVQVQVRGVSKEPRELPTGDGSLRWQVAGKDADYRFVNVDEPTKTYTLTRTAYRMSQSTEAGLLVLTISGTGWLILFPEDEPAGPSTTVFSGAMVLKEGTDGVFRVTKWTGNKVDVCAAIS